MTNALISIEADDTGKKGTAVASLATNLSKKNEFSAKTLQTDNKAALKIQPISSRTRAAAKVQSKPSTSKKAKVNCVLLPPPQLQATDCNSKSNVTTIVKSRASNEVPIKTSRRISNEFEKTEESLYVSAFEEIPADLSRLSSSSNIVNSNSKNDVSSTSSSLSSQSSDLTPSTLSSSEDEKSLNDDVFSDANNSSTLGQDSLPPGVEDFDKENWNDPFQVSNYAVNIFDYLKRREAHYKIKGKIKAINFYFVF